MERDEKTVKSEPGLGGVLIKDVKTPREQPTGKTAQGLTSGPWSQIDSCPLKKLSSISRVWLGPPLNSFFTDAVEGEVAISRISAGGV